MNAPLALSISRPWPWAILHATSPKRIENRQRKDGKMPPMCRYRGPLLLHAAKSWDRYAVDWMLEQGVLSDDQRRGPFLAFSRDATHPPGVIFARCQVVGHIEPHRSAHGAPVIVFRLRRSPMFCVTTAPKADLGAEDRFVMGASDTASERRDLLAAGQETEERIARELDLRWWMGGYGLVLADVEPTPLVPCKGARLLWKPPLNVLEELERKTS